MSEKKDQENNQKKSQTALREEATLEFWKKNKIFEKSLTKPSPKGEFVFYDGPPFATGQPHYGHLLAGTMKDVIPRFKTMQGYHVPRVWGWDCHGLPVENLVEKELGLKSKKDIEEYGIEKFNDVARASVMRYDADWKRIVPRTGRFIDMDLAYLTMNWTYSESIWWSFKTLNDKNLVYQGFKVMQFCPHCETTLSNFEVTQGYKDITDISVYAKFELVDEPGTFVVAWTTTPWTLPGNVALAINPEIQYVLIKTEQGNLILAKERLSIKPLAEINYEIVKEFSGKELVGKKYKPVFDYYLNADLKNKENLYKIVAGDFVTTTDGTGIVHIAPAFGEDDYNLSLKENLPFIQHVATNGTFKKEVTDFAGKPAKPKDDHQAGDVEIIKYLAKNGTLFAKEKIVHSYPHCWRCDSPLLNYATSSWFVKVTDLKDKLVEENKKVYWVPQEIGEGRFGKWLEGAKDWAVSRSRFWGAPIPVWICKDCNKQEFIGSVDDIRARTKRNTYYVVRHGEAENNVAKVLDCNLNSTSALTEKGKKDLETTLEKIKDLGIDVVISSDILRTKQTAEMLHAGLKLSKEALSYDERLREYNVGDFNGKSIDEWHSYWAQNWGSVETPVPHGESPIDIRNRVQNFIEDIDQKYEGKTILIVSHEDPLRYLLSFAKGESLTDVTREQWKAHQIKNAEWKQLGYAKIPRNRKGVLDLHRPFIDDITFTCSCGGTMHRVPEVFDTWYESGSMPYGQLHYPFENKNLIDEKKQFPADFIAEGQDQTRGWFYSLLVLSTGLFDQSPYKNVIVNGIILAEDGQKMSKRLKNYPDVEYVLDTYGADIMRYYLLSSPAVRAEDLAFSEKGLDEVVKKLLMRLQNVYTFYATYAHEKKGNVDPKKSTNVLDQWILARLNEVGTTVTTSLEKYELDRASRPFMNFVDDLSTWYLRRSRDRFKGDNEDDKQQALATLHFVFLELSKLLAPFMPFIAEDLYQKVKGEQNLESVHLENWSEFASADTKIIDNMQKVRDTVSLALEARAKANIKIRQPLQTLSVRDELFKNDQLAELLKDEVNVKEISIDSKIEDQVKLDTTITESLQQEGNVRELIRAIQDLRKKAKLNPHDIVSLSVATNDAGKQLIEAFSTEIKKVAQLSAINFVASLDTGEEINVEDLAFKIKID